MDGVVNTVKKDVRDFTTLSPQVRFLLVIQLIILFILSILVGIIFSPKFKDQVKTSNTPPELAEQVSAPIGTRFQIVPADEFMKPGEEITFSVTTSGEIPFAADVVIAFDPAIIEVTHVENGDYFDREIVNTVENGRITFSAALNPGAASTIQKEGTVLRFTAQALQKTEETKITFIEPETIAARDGQNILGETIGAAIHIFD